MTSWAPRPPRSSTTPASTTPSASRTRFGEKAAELGLGGRRRGELCRRRRGLHEPAHDHRRRRRRTCCSCRITTASWRWSPRRPTAAGVTATLLGADGWDTVLQVVEDASLLEGAYYCAGYSKNDDDRGGAELHRRVRGRVRAARPTCLPRRRTTPPPSCSPRWSRWTSQPHRRQRRVQAGRHRRAQRHRHGVRHRARDL